MNNENKIEEQTVTLIASGYEWVCPDEECEHFNREIEITDTVTCRKCSKTYNVDEAYHAHS